MSKPNAVQGVVAAQRHRWNSGRCTRHADVGLTAEFCRVEYILSTTARDVLMVQGAKEAQTPSTGETVETMR